MTYENAWITQEDVEKYELDKDYEAVHQPEYINGKVCYRKGVYTNLKVRSDSKYDWTIDREKNIYLRYGGAGRTDNGDLGFRYFLLNWKGERIYFAIKRTEVKEFDQLNKIAFYQVDLKLFFIPERLNNICNKILVELRVVLSCYGDAGLYSRIQYVQEYNF